MGLLDACGLGGAPLSAEAAGASLSASTPSWGSRAGAGGHLQFPAQAVEVNDLTLVACAGHAGAAVQAFRPDRSLSHKLGQEGRRRDRLRVRPRRRRRAGGRRRLWAPPRAGVPRRRPAVHAGVRRAGEPAGGRARRRAGVRRRRPAHFRLRARHAEGGGVVGRRRRRRRALRHPRARGPRVARRGVRDRLREPPRAGVHQGRPTPARARRRRRRRARRRAEPAVRAARAPSSTGRGASPCAASCSTWRSTARGACRC